jgi:cytochrome c-type biogenesis protein CcmH/NrfG
MVIGSALIIAVIIIAVIQAANYSALEQKRKAVRNKSAMKQTQMSEETKRLHNQIMSLETEVAQNPADISKTTDLANSYFDIGNFGKAIDYYEKVLKVAPDNPNILIDTGVCYFNLSKSDSAIFYLKKALAVDPNHKQGLYNLGIIYYNLNKTDEAVSVWKKLIQIHGGSREAENARKFIEQISKQSKSL